MTRSHLSQPAESFAHAARCASRISSALAIGPCASGVEAGGDLVDDALDAPGPVGAHGRGRRHVDLVVLPAEEVLLGLPLAEQDELALLPVLLEELVADVALGALDLRGHALVGLDELVFLALADVGEHHDTCDHRWGSSWTGCPNGHGCC